MSDKTPPPGEGKLLVQCDFDGTATNEDISFMILDAFANGDWRHMLTRYQEGKITVGCFNTRAFIMVKEDEAALKQFVRERFEMRDGFVEMVEYCRNKGIRFVIVSNGMEFYIRTILEAIGLSDVEVIAAKSDFGSNGIEARYLGPDGRELQNGFKEEYSRQFISDGYRIAYIGNGDSDIPPSRLACHVFATGNLLDYYKAENLNCTPFDDFSEVIRGLELIEG